jgi:periplasmic protein TonB
VSGFRLPLALSLGAHAIIVALLLLLPAPAPPVTPALPSGGIEVAFVPSLPKPAPAPPPSVKAEPPPAPPQPVEMPPPPPELEPQPTAEPPPEASVPVPEPVPLPPPPKPPVPPRPRPVIRRVERPPPAFAAAPPVPTSPAAPIQQAVLPPARAPAPSTAISSGYEALLGAWLNSHKRYPESARERGEEGRAVLQFAVARSGRIEQFAVIKSSGYPDLDAAVEEMMRGATLPPFPADMPQSSITVSVTIRFSLER